MPKINIRNLKQNITEYKNRSKLQKKDELVEFVNLTKMSLGDINDYLDSDIKITAKNKNQVLINEYLIKKEFDRREAEITRREQEFDDEDIEEPIFEAANEDFDFENFDDEGQIINNFDVVDLVETKQIYDDRLKLVNTDKYHREFYKGYEIYSMKFSFHPRLSEKSNDNINVFDIKKEALEFSAKLPHKLAKTFFSNKNINNPVIIRILGFDLDDKKKYIMREYIFDKFNYILDRKTFRNKYESKFWFSGDSSSNISIFTATYYHLMYGLGNIIPQLQFIFPEKLTQKQKQSVQYFKHGIKNCFLTPLLDYYESLKKSYKNKTKINYINQLSNMFKNGVPEHYIQTICDKLVCTINIYDVYRNINKTYEGKNATKNFKLINTQFDHVDIFKNNDELETEELEQPKINEIYNELLENKKYFIFKKNTFNVNEIITDNSRYLLKSQYNEYVKDFKKNIDIYKRCAINHIKDKKLSDYLASAVHSNNCVDFKDLNLYKNTQVKEIDQIKSHTQFKKCKYYKGFLGKPTDIFRIINIDESEYIKFLNNVIGIFTVRILNNDNVKVIEYLKKLDIYNVNTNINIPSPEISFLLDLGFKVKILWGCFSPISCNFEFEFNDDMTFRKDDGIPYYSKFCGQLFHKSDYETVYCKYDYQLRDVFFENYKKTQYSISNDGIMCLNVDKENGYWYPQIYAFILSYARLNVLNQLFNIDIKNVLRIVGDGIYIYGDSGYKIMDSFRIKSESLKQNVAAKRFTYAEKSQVYTEHYIIPSCSNNLTKFYDQQHVYFIGGGGSGKTYNALSDISFNNVLYVAPSHKLLRAKKSEFPNLKTATLAKLTGSKKLNKEEYEELKQEELKKYLNSFIVKKTGNALKIVKDKFELEFPKKFKNIGCLPYSEKHFPSVIICDEVTQYTEGQRNKIIEMYPKSKIIFCGDIDKNGIHYQLPNISGEEFKLGDNIVEFNENKRCKDPVLLKKLNFIRDRIKGNWSKKQLLDYTLKNKLFNIIKKENVKNIYTIDDYILCSKHIYIDEWTNLFTGKFDKEKYYIHKKTGNYCNGDIVISDVKPPSSDIKHAFTCHAIQGETIKNKIFIDTRNLFENQMLYTALSRAQYGNQIYLII